jgi:hypothetical protein
MNEILAETAQHIKKTLALPVTEEPHASAYPRPPRLSQTTGAGTSPSKLQGTPSEIPMRDILFACQDTGIAIMSEDLVLLDCNSVFAALLMGKDLDAGAVERVSSEALKGTMLQSYVQSTEELRNLILAMQYINSAVVGESLSLSRSRSLSLSEK